MENIIWPIILLIFLCGFVYLNYFRTYYKYDDYVTCWYKGMFLHREGGPAVCGSSYEEWYKNGKLHKEDGPAVIYYTNLYNEEYYLNDKRLTKEEFFQIKNLELIKLWKR